MTKFDLTPDQLRAKETFVKWLANNAYDNPFVLSGFAGSGKTYLSIKLLKIVEKKKLCWTVVAPTHKAVGVLRKALQDEGLKPTWYPSTVHRLLRLRLKRNNNLEVCEETAQTNKSLEQLDLVLIDEASMISRNLLEIVLRCAHSFKTRLVFVGDSAQLPPVGEAASPVFSMNKSSTFSLNQVVRHQGPVLKLANLFRRDDFPCDPLPCFKPLASEKGLIASLNEKNWFEMAKTHLRSASEKDDIDSARILCYTNRSIDRLVPFARRAVHGDIADEMPVLPGEVLISRKAVMSCASVDAIKSEEEPGILFGSNTEMVVKDISPENYYLNDELPSIETLIAEVKIGEREFSIRLMPEVSSSAREVLDKSLTDLSNKAKSLKGSEARSYWRDFFSLRDSFAHVGPASVISVHRSQGSTFERVFVTPDIFWPKDISFRRQLAYVAVTRASKEVWFLGCNGEVAKKNYWRNQLDLISKDISLIRNL